MENLDFINLLEKNKRKWFTAAKAIATGLFSGLFVSIYRIIIESGTELSLEMYRKLRENHTLLIPYILVAALFSYVLYRLVNYEPMASGSGIPQVSGMIVLGKKIKSTSVLIVRFIGGFICSIFGLSVGREGPSIQVGAASAQILNRKISDNQVEENILITAGATSGLSAAFNAPLSGIVFALEEIHKKINMSVVLAVTTAALSSDLISKLVFGLKPVLSFAPRPVLPLKLYFIIIPVGIFSGIIGSIINKMLLSFKEKESKIDGRVRFFIIFMIATAFGLFLPEVLGGGTNLVEASMKIEMGLSFAVLVLVTKMLFTALSFGSSAPGGIFMPILSIGAVSGLIMGLIATRFGMSQIYIVNFTVLAMAGAMSASVKAPVTAIILMAEMTGSLTHFMPVVAVAFLALFISDMLKIIPIYEALLERIFPDSEEVDSYNKDQIFEIQVNEGSFADGKSIKDINWPRNSYVLDLKRGEDYILAKGRTVLKRGDKIKVVTIDDKDN